MIHLQAFPIYPDIIRVQWEYSPKFIDTNYTFNISLLGPDHKTLESQISYHNYFCSFYRHAIDYYYIKIEVLPGNETLEQPLFYDISEYEFNIANEIVRKETLLFEQKIGRKCKIFKRKYFGQPCTHCIDAKTGTITDSNCKFCYGTKYGFFEPVQMWCDIAEQGIDKQITDVGTTDDKKAQMRLSNFVLINKGDIIIEEITKQKWQCISEPQIVRYRVYPISQICMVSNISTKKGVPTI